MKGSWTNPHFLFLRCVCAEDPVHFLVMQMQSNLFTKHTCLVFFLLILESFTLAKSCMLYFVHKTVVCDVHDTCVNSMKRPRNAGMNGFKNKARSVSNLWFLDIFLSLENLCTAPSASL